MDYRRIILWTILALSLFVLWQNWLIINQKTTAKERIDSTNANLKSSELPNLPSNLPATENKPSLPSTSVEQLRPAGEKIKVKTDVMEVTFSTQGGQIEYLALTQHKDNKDKAKPVVLFDTNSHLFLYQSGVLVKDKAVPTHKSIFKLSNQNATNTGTVIELIAAEGDVELIRRYEIKKGSYTISQTDLLKNIGNQAIQPSLYYRLLRDNSYPDGPPSMFSTTTYVGPAFYSDTQKFHKVSYEDVKKNLPSNELGVTANESGWVAMVQHYFVSALITPNVAREFSTHQIGDNFVAIDSTMMLPQLEAGASSEHKVTLYAGPQESNLLNALAPGLDLVKDYGVLTIIAQPIFWLLSFLHSYIGNWGWAIVVLTLLIKALFYPLSAASYKSMANMKKIMPKMTTLRERYANDKMKLNQEMMALYKTEKINPLGGCLPIAVQIPVFIALYWVLLASAEMRGAPWLGWIEDLAAPDPFYILPILMAASMFVQTKLNPAPADPLQAKVMLFMPLVFSIFFFFFPSGLVLYWVVNNLVSIAQQWVITKRYAGKAF